MPRALSASSIRPGEPAVPSPRFLDIIFDLELELVISYSLMPVLGLKDFIKSESDFTVYYTYLQVNNHGE
jgi:hypothetical protein